MHTPETHQKFIERRAQGWSLVRIATDLGIAKSTLIEWSHKFRFEIQNQRAIALDDLQNRVLGSAEARAGALAQKLARIETELAKRDLSEIPTPRLFTLAASLRGEIEKQTGEIQFMAAAHKVPKEDYAFQIEKWKP